jgi:aspartate kinase
MAPGAAGMLLTSEFGNAHLLDESMPLLARSLKEARGIVVFPGFFGVTREGRVATFPRGGSDITGSILAAAAADLYENFTDVDAVYPVDPRIVPEVREGIAEMTYREMRELAYSGFGVFHDEAVRPALQAGVTINIRNTNHPERPGTLVKPQRQVEGGCKVVGIASDSGFAQLYVEKYMMNREVGFGRRLMRILEDENISWEHIPTGIDNMSVVFRQSQATPEAEERILRRIRDELKTDKASINHDHALVMVVGEGMQYTVGIMARAAVALAEAGVNIEMLNQGASEISVMFGVKDSDRATAVRALYQAFF